MALLSPNSGLQSFSSRITNIEEYVNNYNIALLTPKKQERGIGGFLFDIPTKEEVTLSSDITDYYTENNNFIQDHRIIKPIKVVLTGLIGELVVKNELQDQVLGRVQDALTTVNAYLGQYTGQTGQILQRAVSITNTAVDKITQNVNRAKNIVAGFKNTGVFQNAQQRAYQELESLFRQDTVLTVQTPWRFYDNMIIETITFSQGEDTEYETEITVTLKEIRFATVGISDEFAEEVAELQRAQQKEVKTKKQAEEASNKKNGEKDSIFKDGADRVNGKEIIWKQR